MALVVQKYGSQGNADFALYNLARAQFATCTRAGPAPPRSSTTSPPAATRSPGSWATAPGRARRGHRAGQPGRRGAGERLARRVPANPISGVTISSPASGATVASGTAPTFAGSSSYTGNPASLSFAWNSGDGTSSAGAANTPIGHTYTITGRASQTFHATLTVSDGA